MTKIEWADRVWNPVVGCTRVSEGCRHCYAERHAARMERLGVQHYRGLIQPGSGGPVWTGDIAAAPEAILLAPLQRQKPTAWFVNSMSDLFHEQVPDEMIDRVFAVMALSYQHVFLILTKRPARMREYCNDPATPTRIAAVILAMGVTGTVAAGLALYALTPRAQESDPASVRWPLSNVRLGTSVEDQARADERIPILLGTQAAIRFVSVEPMLGPININQWLFGEEENGIALDRPKGSIVGACLSWRPPLDWVICGGESGPGARPMHPAWVRALRDQCIEQKVPFFFKQWGEWTPYTPVAGGDLGGDVRRGRVRIVHPGGETDGEVAKMTNGRSTLPGSLYMERVGKRAAGRLLDGREWNEMPSPIEGYLSIRERNRRRNI